MTTKCSKAESEKRVSIVYDMVLSGVKRASIIQFGTEKWDISVRAVEKYITKVYAILKEQSRVEQDIEFSKAKCRYESLYARAQSSNDFGECRRINKDLCRLLGLDTLNINLNGDMNVKLDLAAWKETVKGKLLEKTEETTDDS